MPYYRLYFLHRFSGHIIRFAEYEAPDDASALALAAEHEGDQPLELWCRHRKVMRFERAGVAPAARIAGGANASFPISRHSFSAG